jgi:hypothetical protein
MFAWITRRKASKDSAQPGLMMVERAENGASRREKVVFLLLWLLLIVLYAAMLLAIKLGAFDWRPGDRAFSTIDYRLAPHLQPLKGE